MVGPGRIFNISRGPVYYSCTCGDTMCASLLLLGSEFVCVRGGFENSC